MCFEIGRIASLFHLRWDSFEHAVDAMHKASFGVADVVVSHLVDTYFAVFSLFVVDRHRW